MIATLSTGAVYEMDGYRLRLHYFSASCLLVELMNENTHPFRILRRRDGKLLGIYRQRGQASAAWETWFKDGSHA